MELVRLFETFDVDHVHGAVRQALDLGAIGYDAVKHLVLCRIERRPPRLDLDIYRGQVLTIVGGSGVGKSVTLGMMARYTSADVNVIALIGERRREPVQRLDARDEALALAVECSDEIVEAEILEEAATEAAVESALEDELDDFF